MSEFDSEIILTYRDGAVGTVLIRELGWGPFKHYDVRVDYTEGADDTEECHTHHDKARFKTNRLASDWARDRLIDWRMNG